jgi:hypothetical protein
VSNPLTKSHESTFRHTFKVLCSPRSQLTQGTDLTKGAHWKNGHPQECANTITIMSRALLKLGSLRTVSLIFEPWCKICWSFSISCWLWRVHYTWISSQADPNRSAGTKRHLITSLGTDISVYNNCSIQDGAPSLRKHVGNSEGAL